MKSATKSLLATSLLVIAAVGIWGIADPDGMVAVASDVVGQLFRSRAWFIMLSVSGMLVFCLALAASRYGQIRLGPDDSRPEFSTISWLTMLFSAGMGVGLLFWATAEPLTHFRMIKPHLPAPDAADAALFVTNFHWGLHAWGIYGATALTIAYFSFRRGTPMLVSAPFQDLFGEERWARVLGWLSDFLAIVAIAIGVGGSIAMGVFQVADGLDLLAKGDGAGPILLLIVFASLVACYIPPLLVDLGSGMARLSNLAMGVTGALVAFVILVGPTQYLMNSILEGFGSYLTDFFGHGFRTFTFFEEEVESWFQDWTLTYMVWWLAWGPFVGVFVARISRGRTIREFVLGVLFVPTLVSLFWFGAFGGLGLFESLRGDGVLEALTATNVERVTFVLLEELPLSWLTTVATILAAFLFIVTSVVSAAYVLGMFSSAGDPNPSKKIKLVWGGLLGLLGYAMILSGSVDAVKKVIALGAMPFVFITILLLVCLVRALGQEEPDADRRSA
ncbi:MAG: BCCT family transporter [Pseudomonadota bacterium]